MHDKRSCIGHLYNCNYLFWQLITDTRGLGQIQSQRIDREYYLGVTSPVEARLFVKVNDILYQNMSLTQGAKQNSMYNFKSFSAFWIKQWELNHESRKNIWMNHESLGIKRQELWITNDKWFRFHPESVRRWTREWYVKDRNNAKWLWNTP